MTWKAGDPVMIIHPATKRFWPGVTERISRNQAAVMVAFEAIIDGHVGRMPLLLGPDGQYHSIVSDEVYVLAPLPPDSAVPPVRSNPT